MSIRLKLLLLTFLIGAVIIYILNLLGHEFRWWSYGAALVSVAIVTLLYSFFAGKGSEQE